MTPERQKWWANLPQREKMLREQIWEIKSEISWANHRLQLCCFTPKAIKRITTGIKKKKVVLAALKHELDHTTVAMYVGHIKEGVSSYQCKKCGGMFEDFEQSHCCWCGRKIVGCKSNE